MKGNYERHLGISVETMLLKVFIRGMEKGMKNG